MTHQSIHTFWTSVAAAIMGGTGVAYAVGGLLSILDSPANLECDGTAVSAFVVACAQLAAGIGWLVMALLLLVYRRALECAAAYTALVIAAFVAYAACCCPPLLYLELPRFLPLAVGLCLLFRERYRCAQATYPTA